MSLTKELAAEIEAEHPTTRAPAQIKAAPAAAAPTRLTMRLLDTLTSDQRKQYPICAGFIDYFPDAVAEASHVSWLGNEKHNPGEPLHWARGKSMDHADCIARHLAQRGGFDTIEVNGVSHRVRHSAALFWRAAALLQEELEAEKDLSAPRNAREATSS